MVLSCPYLVAFSQPSIISLCVNLAKRKLIRQRISIFILQIPNVIYIDFSSSGHYLFDVDKHDKFVG